MRKFLLLIFIILSASRLQSQNDCKISVKSASDTVIYSDKPFVFTLYTEDDADKLIWSTGQTQTTYIDLTVNPGEMKQIILKAIFIDDENLVYNGDFELGETPNIQTQYTKVTQSGQYVFTEGKYHIGDNLKSYLWNVTECDYGGNVMFINGDTVPDKYFYKSDVQIIPGSEYLFSFRSGGLYNNISDEGAAKIMATLGDLQSTVSSINIPACDFDTFSYTFVTPASMPANTVLTLYDTNTLMKMNEFWIDDISLRKTCTSFDTITVMVIDSSSSSGGSGGSYITDTVTIETCDNDYPVYFHGNSYDEEGEYSVIEGHHQYVLIIKEFKSYNDTIYATHPAGYPYKANGFEAYESGDYTHYLKTYYGCDSTVTLHFKVYGELKVYLPTAFEPLSENNNKFVYLTSDDTHFQLVNFEIYDRWGTKLFSSSKIWQAWDGTFNGNLCPMGTYIYRLFYKYTYTGEKLYETHGNFILLR